MSSSSDICRPVKITCRWLQEMTEAIAIVCPKSRPIHACSKKNVRVNEELWRTYLTTLPDSCQKHPTVQQLLRYEIDYNTLRLS